MNLWFESAHAGPTVLNPSRFIGSRLSACMSGSSCFFRHLATACCGSKFSAVELCVLLEADVSHPPLSSFRSPWDHQKLPSKGLLIPRTPMTYLLSDLLCTALLQMNSLFKGRWLSTQLSKCDFFTARSASTPVPVAFDNKLRRPITWFCSSSKASTSCSKDEAFDASTDVMQ